MLKSIEALRTTPYDDQTGKEITAWTEGATIGYGHLIDQSSWETYKEGITQTQAEALLKKDIQPFTRCIKTKVKVALAQHEFDALVIFSYNIGRHAFSNSSALKLINDPSANTPYKDLEAAWKAWNRSQNNVMKGLVRRRNAEWKIFSRGIYTKW